VLKDETIKDPERSRRDVSNQGSKSTTREITIFTELDDDMKLSRADPWLLVERALIKVANV